MGLSGLHMASARFHDHSSYLRLLSLAALSPCVFLTLMSQAALRSFTCNLISSMKLNHEKLGLLNSYSLPTLVSQDSLRQTRQSQTGSFLLTGTPLTATHLLLCSRTGVGKIRVWV